MKIINSWKEGWKFYSVWLFAVIAALPDLLNTLSAAGLLNIDEMGEATAWIIRAVAIIGIASRFVSQKKPEGLPPEIDPTP